jgi:hypothetical protein
VVPAKLAGRENLERPGVVEALEQDVFKHLKKM